MQQDQQVDGKAVRDGVGHQWVSPSRVADLEETVSQLRAGLETRQQVGVATGLIAAELGIPPDEAWALLVRLSQRTNVKVRDVGRVVVDAYNGRLTGENEALAARLRPHFPAESGLIPHST
jgi:hypothetical protein